MNRVVARYQDGRLVKGLTNDFFPAKDRFHLLAEPSAPGTKPIEVRVADLKGLFFVKDLAGDSQHQESTDFPAGKPIAGRKIRVVFKDGEVLVGTTQGYDRSRPGFFVVPADPTSNNDRCFVVTAATQEVSFL